MAKKQGKKKEIKAQVANRDQFDEVVANCDNPKEVVVNKDLEVQNLHLKRDNLEEVIYFIRGRYVMIDSDLADAYEVETKNLKRAVRANIERFPADFMFELTKEEYDSLRCKKFTLKKGRGQHSKYLPFAFTQAGVAMLSGLLHSKVAVDANIRIMRAFVGMQRFIASNAQVLQRLDYVEMQQLESKRWMQETENKIQIILNRIEENSPQLLPEQIFQTGCVWDAWSYVSDLARSAKKRIILIDNFVDDRVLSLLDKRADGVSATIHSRFYEQFQTDLEKHNKQYPAIEFVQLPHKNHDRFLIIDDKVYLMGASLKDIGAGLCAVTEMQTSPETILSLLK